MESRDGIEKLDGAFPATREIGDHGISNGPHEAEGGQAEGGKETVTLRSSLPPSRR